MSLQTAELFQVEWTPSLAEKWKKINDEFAVGLQLFYKVPLMDYNSFMLIGLFLGAGASCTKAEIVF